MYPWGRKTAVMEVLRKGYQDGHPSLPRFQNFLFKMFLCVQSMSLNVPTGFSLEYHNIVVVRPRRSLPPLILRMAHRRLDCPDHYSVFPSSAPYIPTILRMSRRCSDCPAAVVPSWKSLPSWISPMSNEQALPHQNYLEAMLLQHGNAQDILWFCRLRSSVTLLYPIKCILGNWNIWSACVF